MHYPDRDDLPDTTQLRERTIRSPRKSWDCAICNKERPAGMACIERAGTVDGRFRCWRQCVEVAGECPILYASWPLWAVTFAPSPDYPRTHPEHDKPFTTQLRAKTEADAMLRARDEDPAPNFVITTVVQLDPGTPDA